MIITVPLLFEGQVIGLAKVKIDGTEVTIISTEITDARVKRFFETLDPSDFSIDPGKD